MNLLKGNEKSTTVFILACLQRFSPNFTMHILKFYKENSIMHVYFIMHVYYFFQKFHYACLFHHALLLDTSEYIIYPRTRAINNLPLIVTSHVL